MYRQENMQKISLVSEALTQQDVREEDCDIMDYLTIEEKVCLHTTKEHKTLADKQTLSRHGALFNRPNASIHLDDTPQEVYEDDGNQDLIGCDQPENDLGHNFESLTKLHAEVFQNSAINQRDNKKVFSKFAKVNELRGTDLITAPKQPLPKRVQPRGKRSSSRRSSLSFNQLLRKLRFQEKLLKEVARNSFLLLGDSPVTVNN